MKTSSVRRDITGRDLWLSAWRVLLFSHPTAGERLASGRAWHRESAPTL